MHGSFRLVFVGLVCLGWSGSMPLAHAQKSASAATGLNNAEALVDRLVQRSLSLRDLAAEVQVQADVPRVKIRPLSATMHYLAPDRFHLKSPRLALLPRQNPMELFEFLKKPDGYRSMLMGECNINIYSPNRN